ncbi:chemotaxis protein CheW [Scatolibacter rhodanostii]|uniref:chemotaxis protein CheW n=1 Tax=Scatolibacter rhodanostii TaxID=2014781 RepID=UPI000C069000|nr:chemotaxis protein CheW [Scatolibacter rhodanostii]
MNENHATELSAIEELNGRYLLFNCSDMLYGVPLVLVLEIIQTKNITYLPGVAPYIKGIINLRGKILPVLDIRLKFGIEERPYDDKTCIIVSEIRDMQVGLIVDSVSEVVTVDSENLAAPPNTKEMSAWYIDSVTNLEDRIVLNIDFEKFLKDDLDVIKVQ